MDLSSNASPRSLPTPQSPAPLALSEFMAQATPCSDTTNPSDKLALSQDIPRPVDAVAQPKQASIRDEPRAETPQRPSPPQETQPQETRPAPAKEAITAPVDWLATRQQLLPRRNQGKKADWIRGWSQAVSSYGEETYCACSETIEAHGVVRGRKAKTSAQLADNVRAILQRAGSPSSTTTNNNPKSKPTTPATPEPDLCRLCSRPPSSSTGNGSNNNSSKLLRHSPSGSATLINGKRFFSDLLLRVTRRPSSRSKSAAHAAHASAAHKRDAEIRNLAWPEDCQPRWATTGTGGADQKRVLARPPSQPVSAPVHGTGAGVGGGAGGGGAGAGASPVTTGAGVGVGKLLLKSSPAQAEGGGGGGGGGGYFVWKSRSRGKLLPALTGTNGGGAVGGSGAGLGGAQSLSSELDGTSDSDVDAQHRGLGLSRSMSRLQRAAALLQRATARSKD